VTVRFPTEAVTDIALARDWYDAQSAGLGDAFMDSLEGTVDLIAALPILVLVSASPISWSFPPLPRKLTRAPPSMKSTCIRRRVVSP